MKFHQVKLILQNIQNISLDFFLKILLTGGAASTPGLSELISSKLNIDSDVLNPFEGVDGANDISVDNPSQYTLAMGLCIRAGMEE